MRGSTAHSRINRAAPGQQCRLIEKNTDEMALQSGEREGDGMEVVEKLGCGGRI